jgi:hypothetical protein
VSDLGARKKAVLQCATISTVIVYKDCLQKNEFKNMQTHLLGNLNSKLSKWARKIVQKN